MVIRCIDGHNHYFPLKNHCIIKNNATLRISNGTILELIPKDNNLEPLSSESESGKLFVVNATLKIRKDDPNGNKTVILNTNIIFDGKCYLDASGGVLILGGNITFYPSATFKILEGSVIV